MSHFHLKMSHFPKEASHLPRQARPVFEKSVIGNNFALLKFKKHKHMMKKFLMAAMFCMALISGSA